MENLYEFLLLVHLSATFVLVGAMTHNLLIVVNYLGGKFGRQELEWLYVRVSLWAYVITYVVGALIYPAYRILCFTTNSTSGASFECQCCASSTISRKDWSD